MMIVPGSLGRLGAIASAIAQWLPSGLFTTGVNGAWYDPSDITTLFQDAAGTTPVTAVGQPVGLMLDKSKGLVLGPELVTNGDFDTDTNWTKNSATISGGVANISANGNVIQSNVVSTTQGVWYKYTAKITTNNGGVIFYCGTYSSDDARFARQIVGSTGTFTFYLQSGGVNGRVQIAASAAGSAVVDNISVRELPGNHAFNPSGNSANFPVLSARYNLLTKTEDFSDAAWAKNASTITANTVVAPDGTLSGDKLVENTAANVVHYALSSPVAVSSGTAYTASVFVKAAERTWAIVEMVGPPFGCYAFFDIANGVVGAVSGAPSSTSITNVGNGWYRITISKIAGVSGYCNFNLYAASNNNISSYTGDGTSGICIWGADLRVSNDALNQPAYQRVNTATNYDTVGFKPYLSFNGVNQWLQTNSIDFTNTAQMFVCAGVRKLSDGTQAIVENSVNGVGNISGTFGVLQTPSWLMASYGTSLSSAGVSATAPITNVLSGIGNISAPNAALRVNGSQVAQNTTTQGTGNFGNYPLYIGARAGTSLWFNGRLYQLIVADGGYNQYALEDDNLFLLEDGTAMLTEYGANPGPTVIAAVESFVNQKTGSY